MTHLNRALIVAIVLVTNGCACAEPEFPSGSFVTHKLTGQRGQMLGRYGAGRCDVYRVRFSEDTRIMFGFELEKQ